MVIEPASSANNPARMIGLDVLRGGAVVAILILHYVWASGVLRWPSGPLKYVDQALMILPMAVQVFFALSGFLIASTLTKTRRQPGYYLGYFIKRAARLAPLYYLLLLPLLILRPLGAAEWGGAFPVLFGQEPIEAAAYLGFLQNWRQAAFGGWGPVWMAVTWSLAIEVQFYVIAAFVVALTPPKKLFPISLLLVALSVAYREYLVSTGAGFAAVVSTLSEFYSPFAGVAAFSFSRHESVQRWMHAHRTTVLVSSFSLGLAWVGLSICSVVGWEKFAPGSLLFSVLTVVTLFALVLAFAQMRDASFQSPAARSLRWIGIRCFAIYVLHYPLMHLSAHVLYGQPAYFQPGAGVPALLLGLTATFVFVEVSWRCIEFPAIQWSHRYVRERWGSQKRRDLFTIE